MADEEKATNEEKPIEPVAENTYTIRPNFMHKWVNKLKRKPKMLSEKAYKWDIIPMNEPCLQMLM